MSDFISTSNLSSSVKGNSRECLTGQVFNVGVHWVLGNWVTTSDVGNYSNQLVCVAGESDG